MGQRRNVFEGNDTSYANNNCIEAQCPRNTYRRNKANHGSHGIWVGLSNETIVEDNEACYNGLLSGFHNAPWGFTYTPHGPQSGAAGIIMAGFCNHTICRGNKVIGNNGCGICLFGDNSPDHKFTAFHWVLENNVIKDNRWGIYMEFADWIDMAGNVLETTATATSSRAAPTPTSSYTPTSRRSSSRPRPSSWPRCPRPPDSRCP